MSAILSQLVRDERLVVVDSPDRRQPETKEFAAKVKSLGLEQALVITKELDETCICPPAT